MTGQDTSDLLNPSPQRASWPEVIRLLVIPLLLYVIWLIEIFLLEGSPALFLNPDPVPLVIYTAAGCVLIGILAPVLLIRRSFASRSVNMLQIGFRPLRRTVAVCTVTAILCYFVVLLAVPAGPGRVFASGAFLLYLPTAIAAVMICWVYIGTHLQALVRTGGAVVSIPTGVVITSILFGIASLAHTPAAGHGDTLVRSILLGIVTALVFFAARDVYATVIVATTGMVLIYPPGPDAVLLPGVFLSAALALGALFAVHAYFSRNYTTVIVVPDP